MSFFQHSAEDKIKKAIEAGEFDNLPGKGKPLKLDDNPFEPEELRMAHRLLKSNDFTLPWIETWKEIEQDREAARRALRQSRDKYWAAGRSAQWELARSEFASQVAGLNRRVLGYNLSVPSAVFQKPTFDLETEIRAALNE